MTIKTETVYGLKLSDMSKMRKLVMNGYPFHLAQLSLKATYNLNKHIVTSPIKLNKWLPG